MDREEAISLGAHSPLQTVKVMLKQGNKWYTENSQPENHQVVEEDRLEPKVHAIRLRSRNPGERPEGPSRGPA